MTKVLMLGFSVTEMPSSYVPRLKSLAATRGADLEIDHCGIGGIAINGLLHFADRIIADRPEAEWIVFEIVTSNIRDIYERNRAVDPSYAKTIWTHITSLVVKARGLGRKVAFVNLPRAGIDYEADFLEAQIAQVCASYNIPYLSVSTDLMVRGVPVDTILLDDVHPTPAGAEIYAEKILNFLIGLGPGRAIPPVGQSPFGNIAIKDFAGAAPIASFRRHGFNEDYVVLEGGQSLRLYFDQPVRIEGIAVLVGPKSGWLTIQGEGRSDQLFYDEHCYYERMMVRDCAIGVSSEVMISLAPILPDISLLKGEQDNGPRRIGLFYLFTYAQ